MSNLYIIGGSTRSGKTTILHKVLSIKPMVAVQTDAIREGLRKALIDELSVTIKTLSFEGDVNFHRLSEEVNTNHTKHFSQNISQDELTWNAIVGLMHYYDGKGVDLIIEGIEITPERVRALELKDFEVKAAFVSIVRYTDSDAMIAELEKRMKINAPLKKFLVEEDEKRRNVPMLAERCGYKFFSLKNDDFEAYINEVKEYLLAKD